MTMRYVGGVRAANGPHVYFVMAQGCVYVGETQRHPVSRWSQHLEPGSSLRSAFESREERRFDPDGRIDFFAVAVTPISQIFPDAQVKSATQAVEHEVHVLLRARPSILGASVRVISDTERTAPRAFRRWDLAVALARDVVAALTTAMAERLA